METENDIISDDRAEEHIDSVEMSENVAANVDIVDMPLQSSESTQRDEGSISDATESLSSPVNDLNHLFTIPEP